MMKLLKKDSRMDPRSSKMSFCTLWVKWLRVLFAAKSVKLDCFLLLVDETKDISKKEQVTFVLRCIDPKEATICNVRIIIILYVVLYV